MRALEHAVTLNEIHAFQRNVEARIFGVPQKHELAAVAVGFDLAKSLKLPDAVIHVDHIIAGLQLGKIAEEAGGANFAAGAFNGGCDVEKVGMAEKGKAGVRNPDPLPQKTPHQQHPRNSLP